MLCEMQSVSSRIWTRVAVSISYDDNDYTTGTSKNNYTTGTSKILFRIDPWDWKAGLTYLYPL